MDFNYCVYILYSKKLDKFYTGTTDDAVKRLNEHNMARWPDANTVRGIPWELFFVIDKLNSRQAYAIEKHIKRMRSAIYKRNLKKYPEMVQRLRERYPGSSR
ncbi:MAG TPA: GIY-YIG nuclease family protein [Bacteroidia bacterium]|nr:GIY-YIG nuclease family protein [Bacteroidia bacterium]